MKISGRKYFEKQKRENQHGKIITTNQEMSQQILILIIQNKYYRVFFMQCHQMGNMPMGYFCEKPRQLGEQIHVIVNLEIPRAHKL